jgi:alkanesulfonate monooxygenase SsuD/methylene tetrahydromethanopterin reductase-like flavin-dependent oxidoreductase (luciferase family)
MEKAQVEHAMRYALAGARESVREGLARFIGMTNVDELIITSQIHGHEARKRSYEIVMEARNELAAANAAGA